MHYFLRAVARQSEDAYSRASRIKQLLREWQKQVASLSTVLPLQLINQIASNLYLTIGQTSKAFNVTFSTATRAVEKLERLGIIQEVSHGRRNRLYCATKLLDILEEPAKINI